MPDLATIIQNGAANPWFYLPAAILLGALHALELGHSKSLMAAFIVAIRGTVPQAILLGIAAATGHTIIVWGLAAIGLYLGDRMILDRAEPWLLLISGLLIILLALRLIWTVHRAARRRDRHHSRHHGAHDHSHGGHHSAYHHPNHGGHDHTELGDEAHAQAHSRDIEQRFAGRRQISTWEIAWFGFTGGLLPCPAAIAVLLVCLQLKAFTLGIAMVAAFSVGLAITLVLIGIVAAWGAQHAAKRWSGFDALAGRLPYISGAIVMVLGLAIALRGLWEFGLFGTA